MWSEGDTAVLRFLYRGKVRLAMPHVVVDDSAERVVIYIRPGTRCRLPRGYRETYYEQLARNDWDLVEHVWHTHHVLRLIPSGPAHALYLYWSEAWKFEGWYVNLQEPVRRTPSGLDTWDHALDIWIEPDGSWSWKDEDDLAALVERGVYAPAEAEAFRAEGERVLADPPWPTGWEDWRPDPTWAVPELPQGWDAVCPNRS
jgi:hypothetical protein